MPLLDFPSSYFLVQFFLYTNMLKGNPICQKAHWVVKYLKLKWSDSSIELRELTY